MSIGYISFTCLQTLRRFSIITQLLQHLGTQPIINWLSFIWLSKWFYLFIVDPREIISLWSSTLGWNQTSRHKIIPYRNFSFSPFLVVTQNISLNHNLWENQKLDSIYVFYALAKASTRHKYCYCCLSHHSLKRVFQRRSSNVIRLCSICYC